MKKATPKKPAIDLLADVKEQESAANNRDLSSVTKLAQQIIDLEDEIAARQEALKDANKRLYEIQTKTLPELMESFNLKEFTLSNGSKIIVDPFTDASLPAQGAIDKAKSPEERQALLDRQERGFAFLVKNGAGALIKSHLKAELGKDAKKLSAAAIKVLKRLGIEASVSKGVHPGSLVSWIKERIEAGKPVDFETFKVFQGNIAKIKVPKASGKGASTKPSSFI